MKSVTIKDADGRLVQISVSDDLYEEIQRAKRADATKKRIDRARLVKEELSDYHSHILMRPQPSMSDEVEKKLLIEQMLKCLGSLSESDYWLIHRRFFEGAALSSIAEDVKLSRQVVQYRINKAISTLSKLMGVNGQKIF